MAFGTVPNRCLINLCEWQSHSNITFWFKAMVESLGNGWIIKLQGAEGGSSLVYSALF